MTQIWGSVLPTCGRPLHLACPHSRHCLGNLLSQVIVIIIIIITIIITIVIVVVIIVILIK